MSSSAAGSPNSRYVEFDEYVDLKLQKTRSTIKTTDLLVALAGVAAMFLGYLLVFVVLDQWVIPGGFGIGLRWVLLSTLVLLTAAWLGWKVGLPYVRTVNRLFAAREIEKADPELKHSLLNLVDLRESGRDVNASIMRTLEKRAAVELQKIDVAQAIDHRPLMRTAYVLLAIVVLFSMYAMFSPKRISSSIWRSLLPAANVDVATRTEILKVSPGDETVQAGQYVDVWADIAGEVPEKVWLVYSTIDGASQDIKVPMRTEVDGQTRFKGKMPVENGKGIFQDILYTVRAGDAESHQYRISVKQPPQASGHRVHIEYPAYMKLEPVELVGGTIDSWEGSKVTLSARTNMAVKSAVVEWLDDNKVPTKEETPVIVSRDGQELTANWTLSFGSDGKYPKYYQIQCRTETGEFDPSPIINQVTIRPDLPPEVAILDPVRDVEAPANTTVPLLIEARDPDFELSHVYLHLKKNGQEVERVMLNEGRQQRAMIKHDVKLDRLVVKAGDEVQLSVEAFDNKQPRPNRKSTPELKVKVIEPVTPKEAEQKLNEDKAQREQKLQDVERDQNPDRQPNQPMEEGKQEDKPREKPQPEQKQPDPMEKRQQNPNEQGEEGSQQGAGGKSQSKNDKQGQGNNEGNQSEQSKGSQGEQGKSNEGSNQKLSSDGDDDKEALEKLMQRLKSQPDKKSEQKNGNGGNQKQDKTDDSRQQPGAGSDNSDKPKNDGGKSSQEKNQDTGSQNKSSNERNSNNPDASEKKSQGENTDATGKNEPMPQSKGSEGSKPEKPQTTGTREKNEEPDANAGESQSKNHESGTSPQPKSHEKKDATGNNSKNGNEKTQNPKPENGGPKNTTEKSKTDAGTDSSKNEDPANKPQTGGTPEQGGQKGDSEKNRKEQSSQAEKKDGTGEQAGGNSEDKPPMKPGSEGDPSDSPNADGPREQTKNAPGAKQEKATGNETGTAKPDDDPNRKATQSNNPDLKRDPNEKAATRPGERKTNDPTQTKDGDPAKAKPQPKDPDKNGEKIDQEPNQSGKPSPKNRKEERDGESKTANEPMKGDGAKEQRSKTPTGGGEGGSSKKDSEGNSGSNESGKGDPTQRPGSEQAANNKSETGNAKQPGPGEKTREGNGDKKTQQGTKSEEGSSDKTENKSEEGGKESGNQPDNKGTKEDSNASRNDGKKSDKQKSGQQNGSKESGKPSGSEKGNEGESGKPSDQEGGEGKQSESGDGKQQQGGKSDGKSGNSKPGKSPSGQSGPGLGGNNEANGAANPATEDGDEPNLEYKKQAAELVLKKLQDQLERGDVDPELLQQLGWTEAEMRRFTERMSKYLQDAKSTEPTPESAARRQQFEEMLKGMKLKEQGVNRAADKSSQREVKQVESRQSTVSPEYRSAAEKFTKELSKKQKSTKPSK